MIKVSVVVPIYNSAETIAICINSIINQTYTSAFEIIIVNDGSTDDSKRIIEKIITGDKSNRIIKLINQENFGVSRARNVGINNASGEWIALLDSDDEWNCNKLERQFDAIRGNKYIRFLGSRYNNDSHPFYERQNLKIFSLNIRDILFKWYPSTPTELIRKDVFALSGMYNENMKYAEDADLVVRIMNAGVSIWVLNDNLVNCITDKRSFGDSGLSHNMMGMYRGELRILKCAFRRHQINWLYYLIFYLWISIKLLRRIYIVTKYRLSKYSEK